MYLIQVYAVDENQGNGLPNPDFPHWVSVKQTFHADIAKEDLQTYSKYYKAVRVMQTQDAKDVTEEITNG